MTTEFATKFRAAVERLGGPATIVNGGAGDVFMEIMNTQDRTTWMCLDPVTSEQFDAVQPDQPFIRTGRAAAAMDFAAFAHSPGTPDEFATMHCCGLTFRHVATPEAFGPPSTPSAPVKVIVHKHHMLGFSAGREITVMDLDGETFIELIGNSASDAELELPTGASLRTITFTDDLIVELPAPTTTYFWFGKGRSFQGPVGAHALRA